MVREISWKSGKSQGTLLQIFNGNLINWKSRKAHIVMLQVIQLIHNNMDFTIITYFSLPKTSIAGFLCTNLSHQLSSCIICHSLSMFCHISKHICFETDQYSDCVRQQMGFCGSSDKTNPEKQIFFL